MSEKSLVLLCRTNEMYRKNLENTGFSRLSHGSQCWVREDKTTWMLFYRTVWHKVRVFKFKLCLNAENDTRLPPAPKVESAKLGRHTARCAKRNTRNFCFGYFFSGSPCWARTSDTVINSHVLCQLS